MLPAGVRARERGLVSLWQRQSRRKRLGCCRGDTRCSRGKGTGRASAGAALLGRRGGKSRGQDQDAKESERERRMASPCLQDYFGKD